MDFAGQYSHSFHAAATVARLAVCEIRPEDSGLGESAF
jgi:hypothetical protein